MSFLSQFMRWTVPSEFEDPFWNSYEAQINDQDGSAFLSKMMANMFLTSGGTRTWNSGSGLFTWTADFVVPIFHYGKKISIQYGPDGLTRSANLFEAQALVITLPMVVNDNLVVNFAVASQLSSAAHNQWVAGCRVGSVLQLRGLGELT